MPTSRLGSRCMSKRITQSKSRLFFGSLADKTTRSRHVRFTPDSGHSSVRVGCLKSANSGHQQSPVQRGYSLDQTGPVWHWRRKPRATR